jgi:hypothetical protein
MKRAIPDTPAAWLEEIRLAIADAEEAKLFVSAHLALELIDEPRAEAILTLCEQHLD